MKIHDEPEPIYGNREGDASEVVAAVRAARIGLRAKEPAMFRVEGGEGFEVAWKRWVDGEFKSHHAPQLVAVHRLALEEAAIEVAELDAAYGAWVDEVCGHEVAMASLRLGRDVLDALRGAKSVRLVERLSRAVDNGAMAGHFVTLIGCHAAVMNVALAHALVSLAYHEWKLAGGVERLPAGVAEVAGFGHDAEDAGLLAVIGGLISGGDRREGVVACA